MRSTRAPLLHSRDFVDALGQQLYKGDRVAYVHRAGRQVAIDLRQIAESIELRQIEELSVCAIDGVATCRLFPLEPGGRQGLVRCYNLVRVRQDILGD